MTLALLRALVLGHAKHNRLRTAVTLVAVILGVAISLSIDLANTTAVDSFASSVNVISRKTNLQVLGIGRGFDERTYLRVRAVPGVGEATPTIEDEVTIGAKRGDPFSGEILRILGVDLLRPLPRTGDDTGKATASPTGGLGDLWSFISNRGAVVSQRIARAHHLRVGTEFAALAGDRIVHLRVGAILPGEIPGLDSSVVFVDIVTAQELFGKVGSLDRIDMVVDPKAVASVQRAVRAVLPPGARVIQPETRTGEIRRMLQSFQLNLAALSSVALLVGMYLIYNTVAISVVQRRPEVGTLRALGVARGAIFRTFLAEGLLFGVVGGAIGVAVGCVLATFSVGAVSKTVDSLYVATHADHVIYAPLVLLKGFVVGVVLATISAIVPAIEAARTLPAITMRAQSATTPAPGESRRLALGGCVLLALAALASRAPAIDSVPVFGYLSGLLIIFGASLCTPVAIASTARIGGRFAHGGPPTVRIALAQMGASTRRNAVAVASLMVAIAMMVSVAILIGSFRTTVLAWADETLRADLFVRPLGLSDASYDTRFSPRIVADERKVAGVAAVDTYRILSLPYRGALTSLASTDFISVIKRDKFRFLGGVNVSNLARTMTTGENVIVSEPFATRFGSRTGDAIELDTPSGKKTFRVRAVYNDYSSDSGVVVMDSGLFRRLFHDDSVNSLAIYAAPGVDLNDLRSRVIRAVLPRQIDVATNRELRKTVIQIFDRTFAITYALYVIAITIAVLGVISTLFALVLERKREIGLLRYLGLTTGDVRRMVLVEAGAIGALGGVFGVASGVLLALLLIYVINRQAFGWLIELRMPYAFLGETFIIVILVALVAALFPASVAARIRTAEAVRSE